MNDLLISCSRLVAVGCDPCEPACPPPAVPTRLAHSTRFTCAACCRQLRQLPLHLPLCIRSFAALHSSAPSAHPCRGDVLLAYEMNGRELLPDHSYPVRLLCPLFPSCICCAGLAVLHLVRPT